MGRKCKKVNDLKQTNKQNQPVSILVNQLVFLSTFCSTKLKSLYETFNKQVNNCLLF